MADLDEIEIPIMHEGIYIGTVQKSPNGFTARTMGRVEVIGGDGWNGVAYNTHRCAEQALLRHNQEGWFE